MDPSARVFAGTHGHASARPASAPSLEEIFHLRPVEWLRRMPGRETFAWPGDELRVVKRFQGDEPREWWYARLHAGAPRSPGRREAESLAALAADGLPVPRILAWAEEPAAHRHPRLGGRTGRSAVVMERVAHELDLRRLLADRPAEAERWLAPLARLVGRLHAAGWYHRDLYLQHFVVRRAPESPASPGPAHPADADALVLLDVGRARREPRPRRRWFVKDLAALLHSTPRAVPTELRRRFLTRWLEATGFRGSPASWERDVRAKARRLAAHAPRRVDPGGPGADPL